MIEVLDRVPTYPGRVKMTPVAGQENTYDMVRADAPLEVGTPMNRALFESIRKDITTLQANVSDIINDHAYKTTVSNLATGTEFVLFEGGIRVPFIKLSGEYGGSGRVLVIRKHCYKMDTLLAQSSGSNYKYENSKTDVWLNDEVDGYLAQLDPEVLAVTATVPVETHPGGRDAVVSTIQRKAFLLSMIEYGFSSDKTATFEGVALPYFNSNARRVAQYNGAAVNHWTRSPFFPFTDTHIVVNATGANTYQTSYNQSAGIRPAFTLPADFEVDLSVPNTGNTMATAEVI